MEQKKTETISQPELMQSIERFLHWLDKNGYESYDPYDIWGTGYGLFARKLFYKNQLLGLPFIAPILILDIFFPGMRKFFVKKERYPTADAQLLLAFLNLYAITRDLDYLNKAEELGEDLLRTSIPGYSGHCWGYPFDWQNNRALWRKNTPYITATPYCFEAFLGLYDTTGDKKYLDIALSAAHFVFTDLKDTPALKRGAAGSYSPIDESKVINASAYRAMVLFETALRTGDKAYHEKALKNLYFILDAQQSDGSWLYEIDNPKGRFIDHFHTCFVIKNLYKLNIHLKNDEVDQAIKNGYTYYRENLFDENGIPRSFAKKPRTQIVKIDLYNFAEAITLCSLLKEDIPDSINFSKKLVINLIESYQLEKGYFLTKIYKGNLKYKTPFLRWPQSQLFYAVTNLLKQL
jgi:hypothetical protein